jgi:hypothetical protein
MNNQEIKLFAFQPTGSGQYSFFVMAANENEAYEHVAQYIKKTFSTTCSYPYAGFGTSGYKLTILGRGEVIDNAND